MRQTLLIALLLAAITFGSYCEVLRMGFVTYDDEHYITRNAHVLAGLTLNNVAWAFRSLELSNWHPLTWLSHMLDVQVYGSTGGGHHLTNLLLHAANVVLLFLLLARMTGAMWRSALVAALFAVHPLHVESVAWVSERKDVLSTFFGLLAMLAYVRYVRATGLVRYAVVLLCFALSLMSKPMLVTLPCVLLLLDIWPLGRVNRFWILDWGGGFWIGNTKNVQGESLVSALSFNPKSKIQNPKLVWLILEKLPLMAMSAASSVVTFWAQKSSGAMSTLDAVPLAIRLPNALLAYVTYVAQMFWPTNMAVFYPLRVAIPEWQVVSAAAALVTISVAVVMLSRKRPWMLVGWLWYLGTLVPVIGFVQVGEQARADRYTYVPMIGLFIMLAWGIPTGWRLVGKCVGVPIIVLIIVLLMVLTWRQTRVWRSGATLFEHALSVTGDNPVVCYNLGVAQLELGQFAEAETALRTAIKLRHRYPSAHNDLGFTLAKLNQIDEAFEHFQTALAIDPRHAITHYNFGTVLARSGQMDKAIEHLREAVRLKPEYVEARGNLANALSAQRQFDEAIEQFNEALRLNPRYAEAHYNLGNVFLAQERNEHAIDKYRETVRLKPDYVDAQFNLAFALAKIGRRAEAIEQYNRVLSIAPNHAQARARLAELMPPATRPQ